MKLLVALCLSLAMTVSAEQRAILLKGAEIHSVDVAGTLSTGDLLVRNGIIEQMSGAEMAIYVTTIS